MCGIFGYIGDKQATNLLLSGLRKLEYRGYDSAGIAILNSKITTSKCVGRVANL
jgi:glucosamine--fructose-6-phosphate aminotransferase (isomerizing)